MMITKRLIAYDDNTVRMFAPGRGGQVFSDPVSGATREAEMRATWCHFGASSWVKRATGRINQWHGISDEVDAILSADPSAVY